MRRLDKIRTRWAPRRATFLLALLGAGAAWAGLVGTSGIGSLMLGGGAGSSPEPLGLLLIGAGLVGLAWAGREHPSSDRPSPFP